MCAGVAVQRTDTNAAHKYNPPPSKNVYIMPPFHDKCGLFHGFDGNRNYSHTSLKFISGGANIEVTAKNPRLTFLALGSLRVVA